MTTYRNSGNEQVVFRDDSGKRLIEPGQTFVLNGAQHAAHVETLAGVAVAPDPEPIAPDATVEQLRAAADELNIPVPRGARKAELQAAVTAVAGVAEPDGEPV
jgi:hypothetical protein